jgi:hypothetical protein
VVLAAGKWALGNTDSVAQIASIDDQIGNYNTADLELCSPRADHQFRDHVPLSHKLWKPTENAFSSLIL